MENKQASLSKYDFKYNIEGHITLGDALLLEYELENGDEYYQHRKAINYLKRLGNQLFTYGVDFRTQGYADEYINLKEKIKKIYLAMGSSVKDNSAIEYSIENLAYRLALKDHMDNTGRYYANDNESHHAHNRSVLSGKYIHSGFKNDVEYPERFIFKAGTEIEPTDEELKLIEFNLRKMLDDKKILSYDT